MRSRNMKLKGMMFAGLIIVISFVYAINVQPVVVGKPDVFSNYYDQFESDRTVYYTQKEELFNDKYENPNLNSKILDSKYIKIESRNLIESTFHTQIDHFNSGYLRSKYLINNDILENLMIKIFVITGLYCYY